MAKDNERPQFNPKHRIAGAIILVSLAVIFVPMLLDGSNTPKQSQNLTEIPSRESPTSETKVVVTPVPAVDSKTPTTFADPVPEKVAAAEEAPAPSADTVKVETPMAVPVAAVEHKSETTKAKAKTVSLKSGNDVAEKISKGWVVQVGTFANTENAERLRDKLKGRGFAVSAESVTLHGTKAVRLRVGPYQEKSSAVKAQGQLQKDLNLAGVVLAYP